MIKTKSKHCQISSTQVKIVRIKSFGQFWFSLLSSLSLMESLPLTLQIFPDTLQPSLCHVGDDPQTAEAFNQHPPHRSARFALMKSGSPGDWKRHLQLHLHGSNIQHVTMSGRATDKQTWTVCPPAEFEAWWNAPKIIHRMMVGVCGQGAAELIQLQQHSSVLYVDDTSKTNPGCQEEARSQACTICCEQQDLMNLTSHCSTCNICL